MIEIGMNGVTKNFGFKNVLCGAEFEVMTKDRVALVGRNGSGKTTIFRMIAGQETPDLGTVSIRRGATVGYLEQIPTLYLSDATTEAVLSEPFREVREAESEMRSLEAQMAADIDPDQMDQIMERYALLQDRFTALGGYEMQETLDKVVNGFQLHELLDRPFNVLSGGQKTIVKLASVILRQPDILLLDEPTNHLDMKTLEWFEGYLRGYRGTVILISHDRYFLDKVATKTVILDKGLCTLYHGNYSQAIKAQEEQLLIEFEQYKTQQKKVAAMKAAIKRFREWGAQGDNEMMFKKAKMLEHRLEKMELLERPQLQKTAIPIQFSGSRSGYEVVKLEDFSLSLGENELFSHAELLLAEREKLCLIGDNGTGKTSLIRCILGENDLYSGILQVGPSVQIGYIPQEIRFENDKATVLEVFKQGYICTEGEARNILARYYFFSDRVYKRVSALSGGEKVLLKLAILLQGTMNLLILDEPTNHIDIETREMLEEALADYKGTLLFISHDRYFISKIATRVVKIADRLILPADEYLSSE
ncbi:MAG: ribosomal protection-like ABC-F family protein [Oscillospiraceae bacterium]